MVHLLQNVPIASQGSVLVLQEDTHSGVGVSSQPRCNTLGSKEGNGQGGLRDVIRNDFQAAVVLLREECGTAGWAEFCGNKYSKGYGEKSYR